MNFYFAGAIFEEWWVQPLVYAVMVVPLLIAITGTVFVVRSKWSLLIKVFVTLLILGFSVFWLNLFGFFGQN